MEKDQISKCNRCGNYTILRLIKEIEVEESIYDCYNEYQTFGFNYYYIFKCLSCDQSSIYSYLFFYPKGKSIRSLELLFPKIRNVADVLPLNVKKTYLEAKKVQQISPESFLILIRKSLEQICIDQNAVGDSLYEKTEDLMARRILPVKVSELASLIRKIGNMSAHQNEYFDFADVEFIDEFFSMISTYIYSIDMQIKALKAKWELK